MQPDFAAPLHACRAVSPHFLLCATQTEGSLRRRRRRRRRHRRSHPVSQLTWSGGGCKNTVTSRRLRLRRRRRSCSAVHAACTAAQRGVQAAQVNSHMCAKPAPRARQARRVAVVRRARRATSGTANRFARPPAPRLLGGTVHGTAHPIVRHSPMQMLEMSRVCH